MLRKIATPASRAVERWLPGAFVFAVALTVVVAALALLLTDTGPRELTLAWGDGLIGLLAFMTQVALVLLLGYTLANLPPVRRLLARVAGLPRTPRAAYAFVTVVAGLASLLSFGLGLIVGGVVAVEVARRFRDRGTPLHYPLLVASAYAGFVIWHMGYSGSGPLNAATESGVYATTLGMDVVPVSETTFAPWNLAAIVVTLVVLAVAMPLMAPGPDDEVREAPEAALAVTDDQADAAAQEKDSPADRMETSRVVTLTMGVLLGLYLVFYFEANGFALTLDIVNWSFLCLVLLLVGNARQLAATVARGGRTVVEVLLQYPLYAGIAAMMGASGLAEMISDAIVGAATPGTLGLFAFLAAGLLNVFVPSGGGQFALQAPIFAGAAEQLGVAQPVVIMAIAYGDQWTNMIQPFWAVPLLAVAGLRVRDILGYTSVVLVLTGIVFGGTLLIVGAG
ncbi:Putative short-chain fatty acid transporter [Nocardioides aquaticus]|uniref:Short-chain fatty acid transporter n=1 Tax=Nocardioides aquaticus TaxID=160826 RepID=A0ABX8EDZ0_9ACTN|nr:TIGR00366 family protein [Nocardioides aquaticus]QVT78696.1 Putative short-chain fatty acid transporter [Nocardioides aquaticus]